MATGESANPAEQMTTVIENTCEADTHEAGGGTTPKCPDLTKEVLQENLMEKIRSKPGVGKSWSEMTKLLRTAVAERRAVIDGVERTHLQKVLDTLQKSIKVTSLQSMVERLDSISRQQGLKFSRPYNNDICYISSEMFFVEIPLEKSGRVKDVKIDHQSDHSNSMSCSCSELTEALRNGDFSEFTKHLEGLVSIYQLNTNEKSIKSKAYNALQALELDLTRLAQLQSFVHDPNNLIHKSPVGILQQRRGGSFLKLTYFISPPELVDLETKTSIPLTADAVIEKGLGHSVTVCIENSTSHKLQTVSLISVSKTADGKSRPSFAAHSNLNSIILPATFVLKLPKAIPIATNILKKIRSMTKIFDSVDLSNCQSLLSVIISDASEGKLSISGQRDLFVTLPDQHHCYNMKSNQDLQGVLISSIPFTHPTDVPQILNFLRQQVLFNTVIGSCVRPESKKDVESALKFDVCASSMDHIQVTFVHPLDESLAAVDLDLKDVTSTKCKIYTLGINDSLCTDEYASKVMQWSQSIPVTMRAIIRKAHGQQQQMKTASHSDMYCATVNGGSNVSYLSHIPNYDNNLTNGSSFSRGDFSNLASQMCNKPVDSAKEAKHSKGNTETQNYVSHKQVTPKSESASSDSHHTTKDQLAMQTSTIQGKPIDSHVDRNIPGPKNPLLGTLLAQGNNSNIQIQYQQSKPPNTMLMSMLSDVPSAAPNSAHFAILGQNTTADIGGKIRKQRKRKAVSDSRNPGSVGRSPKRKMSDSDNIRDQRTLDADNDSSSAMSLDMSRASPSMISNTSDATHMGRSMASLEAFVKSESQSHNYPQRSSSTDSYLTHNFQTQQVLNINESSRLSEGGTPSNPDLFCAQAKNQYFNIDNTVNFHQGHHTDSRYLGNALNSIKAELDDDNSYGLDGHKNISSSQKLQSSEKPSKKIKKSKDSFEGKAETKDIIMFKTQSLNHSEDSNQADFLSKRGSEGDNVQTDVSNVLQVQQPHPIIISTSLKIAKSGDGHKISKTEIKMKQKEGRRSTSAGDSVDSLSSKKRSEAKKERKRRRAESADSASGRSPVRSLHLSVDSSLMPPPASPSSESPSHTPCSEQPIRTITLNMKASPTGSSSSSPSRSKSPLTIKKSSSGSGTMTTSPSKNVSSKGSSDRITVKPSPPRISHSVASKAPNINSDASSIGKITLPTSLKNPSKHKQSSSTKSTTNMSHSLSHLSGRSSPSKGKPATLKLKNLNASHLPLSSNIISKTGDLSLSHVQQVNISNVSVMSIPKNEPSSPPNKQGSGDGKANKSAVRCRKGSLNDVIDKLMSARSDVTKSEVIGFDKKESSKEIKDSSVSKSGEGKTKYFSQSDQFTVKQSSQGIKLTVTKTRASDGNPKSGKTKTSSKVPVSGSSSSIKIGSGAMVIPKANTISVSKRTVPVAGLSHSSHSNALPKAVSHSSNPIKSTSHPKNFSSVVQVSTASSKIASSSSSTMKSSSKITSNLTQTKTSSKPIEKSEKKTFVSDLKAPIASEISPVIAKEKLQNSLNMPLNLMPPPNKSLSDISRPLITPNTTKRTDDSSFRHSPRCTPTRDPLIEESDSEKAFRLLLAQSKLEGQNGSEQIITMPKPLDFVPVDLITPDSLMKTDLEDKNLWVSSSTDIKAALSLSDFNPNKVKPDHSSFQERLPEVIELNQTDVSSSNRLECPVNMNSVTPFSRPLKQPKRINAHSEDDSSPESLVIDFPDTPRHQRSPADKKWPSPRLDSNYVFNAINEREKSESSPNTYVKSPYPPLKSPAQVISSSPSLSRPPPSDEFYDELMNEALSTVRK